MGVCRILQVHPAVALAAPERSNMHRVQICNAQPFQIACTAQRWGGQRTVLLPEGRRNANNFFHQWLQQLLPQRFHLEHL